MLQRTLLVLFIATCTLSSGCATVRHGLGRTLVPDQIEFLLGAQVSAQIEKNERVHPSAPLQAYVQRVTEGLLKAPHTDGPEGSEYARRGATRGRTDGPEGSEYTQRDAYSTQHALRDRPGLRYRVKVLDDPEQVNAFAVPGGYLYVYSGLLLIAEDEAELAGVLAHEIGHIVGRHSINQLVSQLGMDILKDLAFDEDPHQIGQIASQLASARFSRDDEREADTFGVRYAIAAGYDPRGLLRFFEKLNKLETRRRSDLEKLFASHPPTGERIRRIERLIDQYGASEGERYRARFVRETSVLRRKRTPDTIFDRLRRLE